MPIKKLYLELTDRCNLNCRMCYRKTWEQAFGDMEEDVLHKLADELKTHTELNEIVIGGLGEPTCAEHFRTALELLKDYKIVLTTNGTLIDGDLAEYLIKYVDVMTLSIDGAIDTYKEIRGASLDEVLGNIRRLNEIKRRHESKKPLLDIQFVLSRENINDIFKVMDIASDLGAGKFIVSNIVPQTEEDKDNILYNRYENIEMKQFFHKVMLYGLQKGIRVMLPNCEMKTMRDCSFINDSSVFICSSGDVAPCYRFSHEYVEFVFGRKKQINKFSFGNITKDSLMNIWNSDAYEKFRSCILNNQYPSCIDCDYVNGCDYINDNEMDCYTVSPSCGDCLWNRKFVHCP